MVTALLHLQHCHHQQWNALWWTSAPEVDTIIISMLQVNRLRHRNAEYLAQVTQTGKWKEEDSNPVPAISKALASSCNHASPLTVRDAALLGAGLDQKGYESILVNTTWKFLRGVCVLFLDISCTDSMAN